MEKLHFSIDINAPKEKVWDAMLKPDSYTEWTSAFAPGSYYKGDWNKGSKILFLDPNNQAGMVSRIKENKKYEYISIEHLGFVQNGKEDTESDAVKAWAGAHENYTFKEENGKTKVLVDMDSSNEFKDMFQDTWPKALQKLKDISER
jgi:hypothetical protein